MSESQPPKSVSLKPPPPPKVPSGLHPAVQQYRSKLDSIAEGAAANLSAIDAELAEFLAEVKTPPPPADDDESPTTRIVRPEDLRR